MGFVHNVKKISTKLGIRGKKENNYCQACKSKIKLEFDAFGRVYCRECGYYSESINSSYYCSCCGDEYIIRSKAYDFSNKSILLCSKCKEKENLYKKCKCCGYEYTVSFDNRNDDIGLCSRCELKEIEDEMDYIDCIKPKEVCTCNICGREFRSINKKSICNFCKY